MISNKYLSAILVLFLSISLYSCVEEETPTKVLMQGTWELTQASDENGNDIKSTVAFPVSAIQLTDDNGMLGTQGPMFTYVVYGGSNWINASSKIKQAFDYANFRFNTGEFFVAAGNPDRFTVEAKLQATAAAGGLSDILTIFGVGNGWLQQVIYHKFIDVKVTFPKEENSKERNIMIWEIDDLTTAAYNYKDAQGNSLLWEGWPVNKFTKGKFTFTKRVKGLNEIVSENI
ncbi:MAG: hypothetical protein M3Q58_00680 [Bacteroidota bacterium]|nr:hypothetical protein [Bacteroidota bacterium]